MTFDEPTFPELASRWHPERFVVAEADAFRTPALVIDHDALASNVATMRRLVGDRWRPHLKTAKLDWTMRYLVNAGVTRCKCATPLELTTALEAGFEDILLAFAVRGQAARYVAELAAGTPAQVSVLVEDPGDVRAWVSTDVAIFIDIDPGMDRTGVPREDAEAVAAIARAARAAGLELRGLHSYEGFPPGHTDADRRAWSNAGYDAVTRRAAELGGVDEIVTSGTHSWQFAFEHEGLAESATKHTVSPGTAIYNDVWTAVHSAWADVLQPAAAVLTRVISRGCGRVTFDAGHKAVSAGADVPNGIVLGHPDIELRRPAEEHGPACVRDGGVAYGELHAIVPVHVNPTINLHDHAVIVGDGQVLGIKHVTARGHDRPL